MKKILTLLTLLLLAVPVLAEQNNPIRFNRIYVEDQARAGSDVYVHLSIEGSGSTASERIKTKAMFLELGTFGTDSIHQLGRIDRSSIMLVPTYDAEPGWYLMRISVKDRDGNRRVKHRFVELY